MSAQSTTIAPPAPSRRTERLWDAGALLLMAGGAALFFVARYALQSMGAGTYDYPAGVTAVSRADFHVLQSQIGAALVAVGLGVGVYSTLRVRREEGGRKRA